MSFFLQRLHVELQLIIADVIAEESKTTIRNLSSTCKHFRSLLAPYIFKSISLSNTEEHAASVLNFATTNPNGIYVKELNFHGVAPGDSNEELFGDTTRVFPPSVEKILSNLSMFPNFKKLSLEFDFKLDDDIEWKNPFYTFDDTESFEIVLGAEFYSGWRALMAKTYTAVSSNPPGTVKSLDLRNVFGKEVSIWSLPPWSQFLGSIENFKISLWGSRDGSGIMTNVVGEDPGFLKKMSSCFWDHLNTVSDFTLCVCEYGPIDASDAFLVKLPFKPQQMPYLKTLHLQHVFIDSKLTQFLVEHAAKLENISFIKCAGAVPGIDGFGGIEVYWHTILDALSDAQPRVLKHLEILPVDRRINDRIEGSQAAKKILEKDPKKRLFLYRNTYRYGIERSDDDIVMYESVSSGDDQRAYDRIMTLIETNRLC